MGLKNTFRGRDIADAMTNSRKSTQQGASPRIVALTGSTGNFGAYILDTLLRNSEISKVYCLNRSPDARERQVKQHETRGLSTSFLQDRVEFWTVDFSSVNWALNEELLHILTGEVDAIIHNAWPVDFNRNFHSFSAQIKGIRQLIDMLSGRGSLTNHIPNTSLADDVSSKESKESLHEKEPHLAPRWRTKIFFISSVGTVSNWASQAPTSRESVPEEELIDWKLARTGYGQSKLLSERLLAHAARTLNIPVDIARVGQLAGPALHGEKGAWPAQEWIPSLIKSSQTLRVLPTSLGPSDIVDWIPVDIAAHVVVDLLQSGSENALASRSMKKARREARFFHIVNPRRTSWSNILPDIRTCLSDATREISIEEWVDCLKSSAKGRDGALKDEIANPALKLMDTFDHIQDRAIRFPDARSAILDTKKTATMSSTLASLEAVNEKWMNLWLRQWGLA